MILDAVLFSIFKFSSSGLAAQLEHDNAFQQFANKKPAYLFKLVALDGSLIRAGIKAVILGEPE